MIPALPPDASYLADGLVIISTLSIISAGIWSSVNVVGRLSTKIVGAALLSVTFPSISTFKLGMFFITSTAVCPVLARFLSTLNIFLSMPISNCDLTVLDTVTLCNCVASSSNLIFPKSLSTNAIIS